MFWADKITEDFIQKRKKVIERKKAIIIRDEKTASGRIHVGSMRGVAMHATLSRTLSERDIPNTFLYEINDFDAFDTVPAYLDVKVYQKHLGKPLFMLPAPEGAEGENYAEYFGGEFARVIKASGFSPQFYYSSDEYKTGKYNDMIRTALTNAESIRTIYQEVSGGSPKENWLPIMVICEKCGRVATTRAVSFDGERVRYVCDQEASGAKGCGHEGEISPFDGRAKLPWKVEWAAKFKVFDVDMEGEGKDLSTKGGARDVANRISQEVFGYEPPYDSPYEFLLIGNRKMSTSKGAGASAGDIASLVPPKIFHLALIGRDIKRATNFDPEGDTIPVLYDEYDKLAEKYGTGVEDDDTRLFALIHKEGEIVSRFYPRFSQVAFLIQMPHMNLKNEVVRMKGSSLTHDDKKELEERALYAREWLARYAPERYVYKLHTDDIPPQTKNFSHAQKEALKKVLEVIQNLKVLDGQELHTALHAIRKERNIEPSEFFGALYLSFLGKENGPKIGWFLSVLDKSFLEKRLEEVSQ
ncbi:lysine--tRNA ligase [Candidatus Kaiserbacteria bacterium]|nr:lysine--tRNA ligase [Candidatus Kaiserbacteria bacterium]